MQRQPAIAIKFIWVLKPAESQPPFAPGSASMFGTADGYLMEVLLGEQFNYASIFVCNNVAEGPGQPVVHIATCPAK